MNRPLKSPGDFHSLLTVRESDMSAAGQLRRLLSQPGLIRSLAAHDVFSAKVMQNAGIPLLFLGGFGNAASSYGLPDLGLLGLAEMAETARRMASALSIPLIVDGDTGYGSERNVARTVREIEQAGAAGLLLEDQVFPKRCGHFDGKKVIPADEMLYKLSAALNARKNDDFVIIARTDARAIEGIDAAIERARQYACAGADITFVEAPLDLLELERIAAELPCPQLANMLVGGLTPIHSAAELEELGFKIAVSPIESLAVTAFAIKRLATTLLKDGRVDSLADEMWTFTQLKSLLNVES